MKFKKILYLAAWLAIGTFIYLYVQDFLNYLNDLLKVDFQYVKVIAIYVTAMIVFRLWRLTRNTRRQLVLNSIDEESSDHVLMNDWTVTKITDIFNFVEMCRCHFAIHDFQKVAGIETIKKREDTLFENELFQKLLKPMGKIQVVSVISESLPLSSNGVDESQSSTVDKMLTAGSFLFRYEIPLKNRNTSKETKNFVIDNLILTSRITRERYFSITQRDKNEINVHYSRVIGIFGDLDYLYKMPVIQQRCLFFAMGGYYQGDTRCISKNSRPISFSSFLFTMKDPKKNIFEGTCDLSLLNEEDYRCAMTIAFLLNCDWVPFDYMTLDERVERSVRDRKN